MQDRSLDVLYLVAPFASCDAPITDKSLTWGCLDPNVSPRLHEWAEPSERHQWLPFLSMKQGTHVPRRSSSNNAGGHPIDFLTCRLDCEYGHGHEKQSGDSCRATPQSDRHQGHVQQPVSRKAPYDTLLLSLPDHATAWLFVSPQY